jgi:hypothetical protein
VYVAVRFDATNMWRRCVSTDRTRGQGWLDICIVLIGSRANNRIKVSTYPHTAMPQVGNAQRGASQEGHLRR